MAVLAEHDVALRTCERQRAERRQSMTAESIQRNAVGHEANLRAPVIGGKKTDVARRRRRSLSLL
jgi:hypothetical protein